MKRKRSSPATNTLAIVADVTLAFCPFDLLNDDLLVRVFCFVGHGVACLQTLARVCKRFQCLMKMPTIWESMLPVGFALRELKPQLLQYPLQSLLVMVDRGKWPPIPHEHLFSLRGTLRSLHMCNCDRSLPISFLVGNFTGLTHLSLNCKRYDETGLQPLCGFSARHIVDFQDALMELKGLKEFDLTGMPIKQETLHTILSQCPLVSFRFACDSKSFQSEYNLKGLMSAVSAASLLTSLDLDAGDHSWTHTLETSSSLTSLKSLQALQVRDSGLTISCFALWMKSFPCLTSCKVFSINGNDDNSTDSLTEYPPALETLRIENVDDAVTESVSEWLNRQGSITDLSVCLVDFLETLDLRKSQLPNLCILELCLEKSNLQRLSHRALAAVGSLPRLSKLVIRLSYKIGVSFESDDLPVNGFRLLQNLKRLELKVDHFYTSSPELTDGADLTFMLNCALPSCKIFVDVDRGE
mmetsp:Transcript_6103/g.9393  ORF Transcript_6103/g.9393 Transcript_6103/m.9393 type:complete len:469 (+) Transcript_6103:162-1568(+)